MPKIKSIKKATSKIVAFTKKVNKEAPEKMTLDDAWGYISEGLQITGMCETHGVTERGTTTFELITDDELGTVIQRFEWSNEGVFIDGDWNWNKIIDEVIEWLMEKKLNTPKKIKKYIDNIYTFKPAKTTVKSKETDEVKNDEGKTKLNESREILEARKKKLYFKIYNLKKKGESNILNQYEQEYKDVIEKLKAFKK